MMRSVMQFVGIVLVRAGILLVGTSLVLAPLVIQLLWRPLDHLSLMTENAIGGWLGGLAEPMKVFEPDETVFDYSLGAEIPRLYYLEIPKIDLFAPVVAVSPEKRAIEGVELTQLHVPNAFAVGWSTDSVPIGRRGNAVLVGHNNLYGEVFRGLWDLSDGDEIILRGANTSRVYHVVQRVIFEEKGLSLDARRSNASWLDPTDVEQLTLISCWPYISNTHRVVIIAHPG